ncbi:MAG TPA: hypothetical protein VHI50_16535, partial [Micromonosporaceae bacterium]|nr:hypothetical protein [Micromonosporaceae bacterium]
MSARPGAGRRERDEIYDHAVRVEALPGDFLYVPKGAIHREGNPGDQESHLVVVRAGHGPAVINVDG